MKRNYHTIASTGKANERKLAEFLSRNGQFLLPMVDLIEQSRMVVEELIDVAGRVTIEAVLNLSAQQVAGVPSQGKRKDGEVYWHGTQRGSVYLSHHRARLCIGRRDQNVLVEPAGPQNCLINLPRLVGCGDHQHISFRASLQVRQKFVYFFGLIAMVTAQFRPRRDERLEFIDE